LLAFGAGLGRLSAVGRHHRLTLQAATDTVPRCRPAPSAP
jgi:hypothetical protein